MRPRSASNATYSVARRSEQPGDNADQDDDERHHDDEQAAKGHEPVRYVVDGSL